ncbi:hypothetical protein L1987_32417 [Smallanthus sonchifolius]|uniref:Uncharacterized protein n=1 Tax=Smallanthus sonchifolius TaxID=185202 RepID=A0ACB9HN70_9ASTR|nr:hypothetical protein L1987_32417 [Smallanthus sonchifolius]
MPSLQLVSFMINLRQSKYIKVKVRKKLTDDKDEEEEMTTSTTTFFPHLHSLSFERLENLKRIGGGGYAKSTTSIIHDQFKSSHVTLAPWSLCQYPREIFICDCESLMEVFETQEINNSSAGDITSTTTNEINGGTDNTSLAIPRRESIYVPRLCNLKKLKITSCNLLQHVFTFSTLESLKQLEELMIKECEAMKEIVKKENGEQRKVVKFPCLKSLELDDLPNLEGFFLGMNDFHWPLLEKVMINKCPQMMLFTCGQSTAPKLKYMHTRLGKHSLECGLNFHVTGVHQTNLPSTSLEKLPPWSFHNLIELHMEGDYYIKCIIPSNELLQLQKLERMRVENCWSVEEVFEVEGMEGTNSEESQTLVQIPNLTQMELKGLDSLKYIWKSSHHHQRTVLEFPNLTTLSIIYCRLLEHVFTSSMVDCDVSLSKVLETSISSKSQGILVREG